MTAVLDESGRIEIPEPVRKALGWKPGTQVEVQAEGKVVRVRAAGSAPHLVREGSLLVIAGTPEEEVDIIDLINAVREERLRQVAGPVL